MGTYMGFCGDGTIPPDKVNEYVGRAERILDQGGMFDAETVQMFGKELFLFKQPEADNEGNLLFDRNYFENTRWEVAGIKTQDGTVWTNKVGWLHFNLVARALYVLREYYIQEDGLFLEDGEVTPVRSTIGWLNNLFGEQYINQRRNDPWKVLKILHGATDYTKLPEKSVPEWLDQVFEADSMLSYWAAVRPDIINDLVENDSPTVLQGEVQLEDMRSVRAMREAKKVLDTIVVDDSELKQKKMSRLERALRMTGSTAPSAYADFGKCARNIPFAVAIRFVADAMGVDFWEMYGRTRQGEWEYPHPENIKIEPVPPVTTEDYLNVSNSDRLYWWTENGDVKLDEPLLQEMARKKVEIENEVQTGHICDNAGVFLRSLLDTLEMLQDKAHQPIISWLFRDFAFYWHNPHYQAAMRVLIVDLSRYFESDAYTNPVQNCYMDYYYGANRPRGLMVSIRQYLAVLSNPALRYKLLGF